MNELIKNLAVEADLAQIYNGAKYPHLVGKFSPSLSGPTEKQLEKFAESVMRECIEVMHATIAESMDLGRCAVETAEWVEADTKRHFGVE